MFPVDCLQAAFTGAHEMVAKLLSKIENLDSLEFHSEVT